MVTHKSCLASILRSNQKLIIATFKIKNRENFEDQEQRKHWHPALKQEYH